MHPGWLESMLAQTLHSTVIDSDGIPSWFDLSALDRICNVSCMVLDGGAEATHVMGRLLDRSLSAHEVIGY